MAGQKPIAAITREDVGRWLSELQERRPGKTVRNVQGALSSVMKDAMVDGLIQRNPFAGQARSVAVRHEEMVLLTPEEFPDLPRVRARALPAHGHADVRDRAALGGDHRPAGQAHRPRALAAHGGPGVEAAAGCDLRDREPKSPKTRRPLSLTPRQLAIVKQLCDGRAPDDYVITNCLGGVLSHSGFYHGAWETTLKRA